MAATAFRKTMDSWTRTKIFHTVDSLLYFAIKATKLNYSLCTTVCLITIWEVECTVRIMHNIHYVHKK